MSVIKHIVKLSKDKNISSNPLGFIYLIGVVWDLHADLAISFVNRQSKE